MRSMHLRSSGVALALILSSAGAGAALSAEAPTRDPFAYCRSVGTIDAPGPGYDGPTVPHSIAEGLRSAFGVSPDAPLEPFLQGTSWRCMDGQVYACTVGANLPCAEKADTSRTPTQAMTDFCKATPDADAIPAYVTGRATVYAWRCRGEAAVVERAVDGPDARGFLAGVWHPIAAPGSHAHAPSAPAERSPATAR